MVPDEKTEKAREILDQLPTEVRAKYEIGNDGELVVKNRAYRRRKPASPNYYTTKNRKPRVKKGKTYGQRKNNS